MKEITTEKIQHIAASYQKAKQKLTSVIEEMRELNNAITEINGAPISYLNLFGKQNNSDLRLTDLSDADLERYQINLETKCWRLLLNQTDIMSKVTQDDMDKIIQDKKILKLFRAVESHGGVLRFVGGAVRDALAGLKGRKLQQLRINQLFQLQFTQMGTAR